ncbi:hypothetical protein Pla108_05500 [Botrimarina colliarenosi]|uniref:Uncharacterized protein n=1 Tax=Botrimarina colliarenosi TaxID=2528001 RepID=A0A5C6AJE8_9BACT|nr:hypothetical protein [Botrimarina colliarenosi]TWT99607.1 hypothetical protein Pla108_05500 [Botrimarina colliarenosi]
MRALRLNRPQWLAMAVAAFLTLTGANAFAEGFWPGGDKDEATTEAQSDEAALVDSPMFKLGWPKIEMPKFAWKPGFGGGEDATPSAVTPEGNPISRALDKVSDSSKRAADNVRGAWGAALNKLSFGDSKETQLAQKEKPGFFSRLFTPVEEGDDVETVQQFIAQDRVGTTR